MTGAEERAQQLYEKLAADPAWVPFDPLISDDTAEWVVDAIAAAIQSAERDKANETWEAAAKLIEEMQTNNVGMVHPIAKAEAKALRSRIIEAKP